MRIDHTIYFRYQQIFVLLGDDTKKLKVHTHMGLTSTLAKYTHMGLTSTLAKYIHWHQTKVIDDREFLVLANDVVGKEIFCPIEHGKRGVR